jgi:hypothetical protein
MANVIGFGVEIALNVAIFAEAFASEPAGPACIVGIGSAALGGTPVIPNDEDTAGVTPHISLYDVHGENFAIDNTNADHVESGENKAVKFQGGLDNDNLETIPEYSMYIFSFFC